MKDDDHAPYINIKLDLPQVKYGELYHARFKRRSIDVKYRPFVIPINNPILDSRQHELKLADGDIELLTANLIT